MDWIRKNPHLTTLIAVAVAALVASGLVALNATSFNENFAGAQEKRSEGKPLEPLDLQPMAAAQQELAKPAKWISPNDPESKDSKILPFVTNLYSVVNGKPQRFGQGSTFSHRLTSEPIPDAWFLSFNLPVTETSVPLQDPDSDGFLNEDEWLAKTNPTDASSHPAYSTKLYFKNIERIPFRLKFNGIDGEPGKDKIEDISFQINTLDLRQPTEFKKIGEMVRNTQYKLEKFEAKQSMNQSTGEMTDTSELTLVNVDTGGRVVLVRDKVVNSPDEYAHFMYFWPQKPIEIRVGRAKKFILLPEKDQFYLVVDITDNSAVIKSPAGAEISVKPIPAPLR